MNDVKQLENNSNKQIKFSAIISYITIFFNIIAGIVYTPWMIEKIGQSDYGIYSLALTLISFFTIDFGLGTAVSRFLSKYRTENDNKKASIFLGIIFKIYIVISILILIILTVVYFNIENIYVELTSEEIAKYKTIFIIVGLYSVASFPLLPLNGIFISFEKFTFIKSLDFINKSLTIITMIVLLILGYKVYAMVIINIIYGIVILVIKILYLCKNHFITINLKKNDKTIMKEIFSFTGWATIFTIAQRFIFNITPTILGIFSGSTEISIFAIAMTFEGYTWTFANALNGLFLPKITRMKYNDKNESSILNLMIKVGRIQLSIVTIIVVGFILLGRDFINLWLGQNFINSYYATIPLIVTGLVTLTQQIGNTYLISENKLKFRAICSLIVVFFSIPLSILLTPRYGAIGASISIFVGNFAGLILGMNYVYHKVLNLNIFTFFKKCHLKFIIPTMVLVIIGILLQYFYVTTGWVVFLIKVFVVTIIYTFMLWFFILNKSEKNMILSVLK